MAKIKLDKEIESIEVPWSTSSEMYKGSRVEEFIKKQFKSKAGYLSRTTDKETDGNYHLRGFADEEPCERFGAYHHHDIKKIECQAPFYLAGIQPCHAADHRYGRNGRTDDTDQSGRRKQLEHQRDGED